MFAEKDKLTLKIIKKELFRKPKKLYSTTNSKMTERAEMVLCHYNDCGAEIRISNISERVVDFETGDTLAKNIQQLTAKLEKMGFVKSDNNGIFWSGIDDAKNLQPFLMKLKETEI